MGVWKYFHTDDVVVSDAIISLYVLIPYKYSIVLICSKKKGKEKEVCRWY